MKKPILLFWVAWAAFFLNSSRSDAATYLVDRRTDTNPAGGGVGTNYIGDLRYGVTNARSGDRIAVNGTGTIVLTGSLPALVWNITIQGSGANVLTVQGAGGSVFVVGSGATVFLSGLTITGGRGNGGGVFNQGTLTLSNVTVRGNAAGDPTNGGGTGAGVWNYVNATLTLNSSTISGNSAIGNLSYAPSRGGGIANYGTMTLNNCTVSGNSATQGFGGGISNTLGSSKLTLYDSTVSSNATPGAAGSGGIENSGTLAVRNTIVAGNTGGDLSGNVTSRGHNVFGTTTGSGFGGTDLVNVTALLGPLQDNGGPTSTMYPRRGSLAIDRITGTAGVDFPSADQRGVSRPHGNSADAGAVEAEPVPSPWINRDVGSVGIAGYASFSADIFTVRGSGAAIYGTSDQFHFVYRTLSGDGQIVARIATVQNTNPNAKAAVMIRESLSGNAVNVMMSIRPYVSAASFQYRAAGGGSTSGTTSSAGLPIWFKLVRSGSNFTGYRSSNGSTWTQAGSAAIPMASNVYIGLAVASYDNSRLCTSTFDNVVAVP